MLYCERCERSFGTIDALYQHTNNSSKHHICGDCNEDFATEEDLIQHFVESPVHVYCQGCDEHFNDGDELEKHYEDAHYYCSPCYMFFSSQGDLNQHNRQNHWYCVRCQRMFKDKQGLNSHLRASAAHWRSCACPGRNCKKAFFSYADLVQHLESGACPSGFSRGDINYLAVRLDRNRVITNPSRLIIGPDGSLSRPRIMQAYATERSFNGRAYECILCRKTFATLSALNSHLSSPAHDEKMYRCPVRYDGCAGEFTTLSGLMQHVESGSCSVHRFQQQVNRALDDLTSKIRKISFY